MSMFDGIGGTFQFDSCEFFGFVDSVERSIAR